MLCIERIHKPNIWRAAEATQKLKNIRLTGKSTETFKESKINSLSLSLSLSNLFCYVGIMLKWPDPVFKNLQIKSSLLFIQ